MPIWMYGFRHENPYDLFYEMADRENAFRSCIGPCMAFSLTVPVVHANVIQPTLHGALNEIQFSYVSMQDLQKIAA